MKRVRITNAVINIMHRYGMDYETLRWYAYSYATFNPVKIDAIHCGYMHPTLIVNGTNDQCVKIEL